MAVAMAQWMIILGRIFVGFGVGMASMTAPLYISEASPARIRGALVSTNGLLITGGQFLAYLINLAFTHAPGTWRWMLGVAGLPALVQFILMLTLPESPRWLYRQNKVEEAKAILEKLYPADEVLEEISALRISVEAEKADEHAIGDSLMQKLKGAFGNVVVRRGLYAGVTVQVAQQFSGISTVMYYSPMIVQFAGFASNKTAMALSPVTSGLNALGSVVSMFFVDRYGRRKMMLISMMGIITCLLALTVVFWLAAIRSPQLNMLESTQFGANATCPSFKSAADAPSWNCMSCLKAECVCPRSMSGSDERYEECMSGETSYLVQGWLPKQNWVPGSHTAGIVHHFLLPWDGNRAMGCQLRDLSTKVLRSLWRAGRSFQLVSESFLTLTKALGSSGTFLLFTGFSVIGITCIYVFVPETKGLSFEEVEKLLETGFKPKAFRKKSKE
ncbi:inositol transporter 4-like [Gossypium australe]|uniref:Inositol transporter 4-like n=1 Tax=Gossypium australe TaxID=47621 RepID=A0A5B6X491_9ROSI|nr:inositol transporter 4-like [Gossypium australe]